MAPETIAEAFARIAGDVVQQGECWLWQGGCTGRGKVPQIQLRRSTVRMQVARVVYIATYGEPTAMVVRTCDEPLCVSPTHLLDTVDQTASPRWNRHHRSRRHLTPAQVKKARQDAREGYNVLLLARRWDVSPMTVYHAIWGVTYKDNPEPPVPRGTLSGGGPGKPGR